jgi:hypothetical protein
MAFAHCGRARARSSAGAVTLKITAARLTKGKTHLGVKLTKLVRALGDRQGNAFSWFFIRDE